MSAASVARFTGLLILALVALAITPRDSVAGATIPEPEEKIVFRCSPGAGFDICIMNPDGTGKEQLTTDSTGDADPEISPDGSRIVWARDIIDIYFMNIDGTGMQRVPLELDAYAEPTWHPNGSTIAFHCSPTLGLDGLCSSTLNATGFTVLKEFDFGARSPEYSPDGQKILFEGYETSINNPDLMILDLNTGTVTNLTNTSDRYEVGSWSPDGETIAFTYNRPAAEGGLRALYTIDPDGGAPELLFQPMWGADADRPFWSPDGSTIAFFCDEGDIGGDEICFVDAATGNLVDFISEDNSPGELWAAGDWGLTGGTPQGDIDCGGTADPIDALKLLRYDAGLSVAQGPVCVAVGDQVTLSGVTFAWGDIDCDTLINPIDALKLLRYDAGLSVAQTDPCPSPGSVLT